MMHKPSDCLPASIFSQPVEQVAEFFNIKTMRHVTEIDVASIGASALVLDADGTLYPYGSSPDSETIDWVQNAYDFLGGALVIVSNNKKVHQFGKTPVSERKTWHDYKLISQRTRTMLSLFADRTVDESIFAITDSPSDIIGNRKAGIPIKNQFLIKSLGAHPVQQIVRRTVYSPAAQLFGPLLAKIT
jgi:hypothetical protein